MGDGINDENPNDGGFHGLSCGIKPPNSRKCIIIAHYGYPLVI